MFSRTKYVDHSIVGKLRDQANEIYIFWEKTAGWTCIRSTQSSPMVHKIQKNLLFSENARSIFFVFGRKIFVGRPLTNPTRKIPYATTFQLKWVSGAPWNQTKHLNSLEYGSWEIYSHYNLKYLLINQQYRLVLSQ